MAKVLDKGTVNFYADKYLFIVRNKRNNGSVVIMVLFWAGISAPDIAHASEFNLETVLVFHKLIHVQGVNNV